MRAFACKFFLAILAISTLEAAAADWTRFRGPNGSGVSPDAEPTPAVWSDSENLKWKTELPGPGSSCPIVVGDKVFVTCWTGYGVNREEPGDQKDLKRNLLCLERATGKVLWNKAVEAVLPEDVYNGMFAEHGYASHTPVSDGERVYAFFGKSGVIAFDMEGNQLWRQSVGEGLDDRQWGSAASPILYKNLLIVPAVPESESLVAFDKLSGKEVWKQTASSLYGTWGSPLIVETPEGKADLVIGVPGEVWGLNPETGKLRWYCPMPAGGSGPGGQSMCASAIAHDGVVYLIGDRGGAVAVKAGGEGDVSKSHVVWTSNVQARIITPVIYDGRMYWSNRGIAICTDAATGKEVFQGRLNTSGGSSTPQVAPRVAAQPGGGRPRGGRGGGFGGSQDYSSPVAADGKVYFISRSGTGYVIKAGDKLEVLAQNKFASDDGDFSASPAISNGEIFVRSSNAIYCVAEKE